MLKQSGVLGGMRKEALDSTRFVGTSIFAALALLTRDEESLERSDYLPGYRIL